MKTTRYSLMRAVVLAACLLFGLNAAAQQRGGSVTMGVESDITGFDPLVVGIYDTGSKATANLIFDTLTQLDDNGQAQPRLAKSWSHSPDYQTWTFNLRSGVEFQDGTPFNAQAVAFNYDRILDPDNHCACAFYLVSFKNVEATDDHTVVFHMRNPVVKLPALLAPSTATNVFHSPTAVKKQGKAYNRHPVGTGPFELANWQSGGQLVLERNADYWHTGHPYLDRVTIRPMPDPGARLASLRAGDTDIIWTDVAADVVKARKNDALDVHEYAASGVTAIVLNTNKPPLDDVRVRRALRYALNLKAFTQAYTSGVYTPATDPYGPGSSVQCGDTGALSYNPKKAKALLADYGKPVHLQYMVTAEPRGMGTGQVFQSFWQQAGVKAELNPVDQTTFVNKSFTGDFEIGGWRMIDLADPDPQMYADFHTGSRVNVANYSNPEVDRLLQKARDTPDAAKRSDAYCKIARILNRDVPWIWVTNNRYFSIAKPGLKGVGKQYSNIVDLTNAWWSDSRQ